MTLYIHTEQKENSCTVNWATATSSVGGVIEVNIPSNLKDRKAVSEIFALNILLEKYPGKAPLIQTSHGAMRKLLKGADRFATTEMASLKIKHRSLAFSSHKKTSSLTAAALSKVKSPTFEIMDWKGLGRPKINSSIGQLEVTSHAMDRFIERICPNGTLQRLQRFVENQCFLCTQKIKNGMIYSVYSIPGHDMRFVLAAYENDSSSIRMTTCYTV